nr:MAG TPA: hypothetical protein [Caudoviricetes sp.]
MASDPLGRGDPRERRPAAAPAAHQPSHCRRARHLGGGRQAAQEGPEAPQPDG